MSNITVENAPGSEETKRNASAAQGSTVRSGVTAPSSMLTLMQSNLMSASSLSPAGKEYLDTVVNALKADKIPNLIAERVPSTNFECHVLHTGGFGIGLLFVENYVGSDGRPPAVVTPEIRTRIEQSSNVNLVEVICVTEGMYARANKAVIQLGNIFLAQLNETLRTATAKEFSNDEFSVTGDISKVRAFIDANSMHDVPARDDIGVLIMGRMPKKNQPQQYGNFRPEDQYDSIPLMAVTGFTRFFTVGNMNGFAPGGLGIGSGPRYLAMTIITDVVSVLNTTSMLAFGLAVGLDAFINQGGWLNQFNSYNEKDINVGRLATDSSTGEPFVVKDQATRDAFLASTLVCTTPILAVDIQEGRCRIPSIDKLFTNTQEIAGSLNRFFGQDNLISPAIFKTRYLQFDGVVSLGTAKIEDSRCIDYLRMAKDVRNTEDFSTMLDQSFDPESSIASVKHWYPNTTTALYLTMRVVLEPDFITRVAAALKQAIRIRYDFNNNHSTYNMSQLIPANGRLYNEFAGFGNVPPSTFGNQNATGYSAWNQTW